MAYSNEIYMCKVCLCTVDFYIELPFLSDPTDEMNKHLMSEHRVKKRNLIRGNLDFARTRGYFQQLPGRVKHNNEVFDEVS